MQWFILYEYMKVYIISDEPATAGFIRQHVNLQKHLLNNLILT